MPKAKSTIQIKNRRASFDYEFLETYTAGIELVGTEIKSIRAGKASLQDAYCYFVGKQLFVRGMNIAQYHWGSPASPSSPSSSSSPTTATPSSRSPSPEAKRNTTSATPSKNATSAARWTGGTIRHPISLRFFGGRFF